MPQFLTDDELLDVPLGNLVPGELARSFRVHAKQEQKLEQAAALHLAERLEVHQEEAKREEEEELHERELTVLAEIAEREEKLRVEAELLDERAIKLHDGRRAYVDGDKYRDGDGRELTGADRAQAEVLHLEQPQAATWQEKHQIDEQAQRMEQMRRDIERAHASNAGPNEAAILTRYEKQLKTSDAASPAGGLPDYSDTDYMGAIGGLTAHPQPKSGPAL